MSFSVAQAGTEVTRCSEGRVREQSQAWEQALRTDSLQHAGKNIGLCTGKLKAMSGEEVESMEQEELADCIGKVGSSLGAGGECQLHGHQLCSSVPLYPGICLLQDQPKAQAQNHKGKLWASSVLQGQSRTMAVALLQGVTQGRSWREPRPALNSGWGAEQRDICHVHQKQEWELRGAEGKTENNKPPLVHALWHRSCYLPAGLSSPVCKLGAVWVMLARCQLLHKAAERVIGGQAAKLLAQSLAPSRCLAGS